MEPPAKHDDRLAAGGLTMKFDGSLDGLRAAVAEEHRIEPPRRDRRELFGERDARFVLRDSGRDVHEELHRVNDCLDDARVRMTHDGDRDHAGHIEHTPAVCRDEPYPTPDLD